MICLASQLVCHLCFKFSTPLEAHWFVNKLSRFSYEFMRSVTECSTFIFVELATADVGFRFICLVPSELKGFELCSLVGAIAPWLSLRLATSAPVVCLALNKICFDRTFLSHSWVNYIAECHLVSAECAI